MATKTKTKVKAKTKVKTKAKRKVTAKKKAARKAPKTRTYAKMVLADAQRTTLKRRLKAYREKRGMSRAELAEKIGCGSAYMYQMENENQISLVSLPALFALAKALKITPSLLLKDMK